MKEGSSTRVDSQLPVTRINTTAPQAPPKHLESKVEEDAISQTASWSAVLVWLLVWTYQTLILLGFHRLYLPKTRSTYSSLAESTSPYTPDKSEPPTPLTTSQMSYWEKRFRNGLSSFNERHLSLLYNSSAFYVSMRYSQSDTHPILRTIGTISIIISANASILAAFLTNWTAVLYNRTNAARTVSSSQKGVTDETTQIAMLKSIPHACTFWSWGFIAIYQSSNYAVARFSPKTPGREHDTTLGEATNDEFNEPIPSWSLILMITVLALCIAHFFAIVVWISCLNPRAHAKRGLPQHRSEIVREDIQPTPFNSETDSLTSPRRLGHSHLPLSPLSENHSSHSWAGMQRSVPSSSRKRLPSEKTSSLGHEVISNDIHAPQVQKSTSNSSAVSVHQAQQ